MSDPLSLLREQFINKKPVSHDATHIFIGDLKFSRNVLTAYKQDRGACLTPDARSPRAAAACGAAARARTTVSADTGPSAPTRVLAADACMRSSAIGREDACAWRRWRRPQLASGRRRLLERRGPRYRCVRPCSHPCWAQAAFICHPHLLLPASARAPLCVRCRRRDPP